MMPVRVQGSKVKTRLVVRGFTLVELILYISASVVILLTLASLYSLVTLARLKSEVIAEVEQQGIFAMERIAWRTRGAQAIIAPAAGASASSLTLSLFMEYLAVIDVDASGVMRENLGAPPANPTPITNDSVIVSDLVFYNLSRSGTPGVIRASFRMSYAGGGRQELTYSRMFYVSASLRPRL